MSDNNNNNNNCICDECGDYLDDSFGDPRVKILNYKSKDAIEPTSIDWICEYCVDVLFNNSREPRSIFG